MNSSTFNGVIAQKLNTLEKVLGELRSLGEASVKDIQEDWRTRRAVERDLQILVEIVLDICQRIISISGASPATTGQEAIERCVQIGVLADGERYRKIVQFRNFVVHRYEQVDVEILAGILQNNLGDFEHFRSEVLDYAANH